MNVRHLILALFIVIALNCVGFPASSNELTKTSRPSFQSQHNILNTLKSAFSFFEPIFLSNIQRNTSSANFEVEFQLEDDVEDEVEDEIEDEVEDEIEDEVEDEIEDEVEDEIEDEVEHEIEDEVEDEIEDEVEDDIEDEVEDEIEDEVEDEIEDEVEDDIEDEVEDEIEDEVEDEMQDEVEDEMQDEVEDEMQDEVDDKIEDEVKHEVDDKIEKKIEDDTQDMLLEHSEAVLLNRVTETASEALDKQLAKISYLEEEKIYSKEWFVLSDKASLEKLNSDGFSVSNKEYLNGLGMYLANLQAPKSFDLHANNYSNLMALNTSNRAVDVNHLYALAHKSNKAAEQLERAKASRPSQTPINHRIGIIDSAINQSHPTLINSQIVSRQFAEIESLNVYAHGTAVASILVGQSSSYQGMLPGQSLWSATVIFNDKTGNQLASTISLIRAIDWLIQSGVDIINMSLAGPDNKLLQIAINRACNQNILVVAAAGNNGPSAKPQYPAAYACTVAVTAIDSHNHIYRRAAQGKHIDLSAYGVNILHADTANAFSESSGTSFAAPIVSAWLALNMPQKIQQRRKWLKQQMLTAEDLGAVGKDPIYGFGTLKLHPGMHLTDTQLKRARGVN